MLPYLVCLVLLGAVVLMLAFELLRDLAGLRKRREAHRNLMDQLSQLSQPRSPDDE